MTCQNIASLCASQDMAVFTIELSTHCVERFRERVRPGLESAGAENELAALLEFADVTSEPPPWMAGARRTSDRYAVIGDIALPLVASAGEPHLLIATTCIPRGGISERARQYRNRRSEACGSRRTPARAVSRMRVLSRTAGVLLTPDENEVPTL